MTSRAMGDRHTLISHVRPRRLLAIVLPAREHQPKRACGALVCVRGYCLVSNSQSHYLTLPNLSYLRLEQSKSSRSGPLQIFRPRRPGVHSSKRKSSRLPYIHARHCSSLVLWAARPLAHHRLRQLSLARPPRTFETGPRREGAHLPCKHVRLVIVVRAVPVRVGAGKHARGVTARQQHRMSATKRLGGGLGHMRLPESTARADGE